MCIQANDDLSPCCGAAIERVYRSLGYHPTRSRRGAHSCHPDDADYSERCCVECGAQVHDGDLSACCHAPIDVIESPDEWSCSVAEVCSKCGELCEIEVAPMRDYDPTESIRQTRKSIDEWIANKVDK